MDCVGTGLVALAVRMTVTCADPLAGSDVGMVYCTSTLAGVPTRFAVMPVNGTAVKFVNTNVLVWTWVLVSCAISDGGLKLMPTMVNDPVAAGAACPGSATAYRQTPTSFGSGMNWAMPFPELSIVTGSDRLVPAA